ncbi:helix-turn-helix domain-containing protein [Enterococcus sp. LJL90]
MNLREQYQFDNLSVQFDQLVYRVGSYHYNWHYEIELLWLLKGHIEINVDGSIHELQTGDLYVINSNSGHATFAIDPDSTCLRLYLSPDFFINQGVELGGGSFKLDSSRDQRNPHYASFRKNMAQLQLLGHQASAAFQKNSLFFAISQKLLEFFVPAENNKETPLAKRQSLLDDAISYLEENFRKEVSLESLAQATNYSTTYLSKLFKSELGINFYEYLTRCRLQHAVKALADTQLKIADIAYENGFSDIKAFNKMFKKHFALTPSEYRKQLNPDLRIIDQSFKEELSPEDQQAALAILQDQAASQETQQVNPCSYCARDDYQEKYNELLAKLKAITSTAD